MNETLCLQELEELYARLLPEEREELLQCLLVAAPRGGRAMIEVLERALLCHATEVRPTSFSQLDCLRPVAGGILTGKEENDARSPGELKPTSKLANARGRLGGLCA